MLLLWVHQGFFLISFYSYVFDFVLSVLFHFCKFSIVDPYSGFEASNTLQVKKTPANGTKSHKTQWK